MKIVFALPPRDAPGGAPTFSFYFEGTGRRTCQARCDHCFIPRARETDTPLETCMEQYDDLRRAGVNLKPMVPDTFSRDGEYLRQGLLRENRLYDQEGLVQWGIAWTSGVPLLGRNSDELLALAVRANLRVVAFTSHGDGRESVPIEGAFPVSIVERAIETVHGWNRRSSDANRLFISLTFTIGRHNSSPTTLARAVDYARHLSVDFIRLNRFIDLTSDHRLHHLMMTDRESAAFLACARGVLDDYETPTVLVSNDFGSSGIEALGGAEWQNNCPGGTASFAIFNSLVYPCDELLSTPIGRLQRRCAGPTRVPRWRISIDHEAIATMEAAKRQPAYRGCIGHLYASGGFTLPKVADDVRES